MKKRTKKGLYAVSAIGVSLYDGFVGSEIGEGFRVSSEENLEALRSEEDAVKEAIATAGDTIIELVTATDYSCLEALKPFLPGQPWENSDSVFVRHATQEACSAYPGRPAQLIKASSDLFWGAERQDSITVEIDYAVSEVEANKNLDTWMGLFALAGATIVSGAYVSRRFRSIN